jgi:diguanylate cyclase (GGDEF)-like protein
MINQSSKQPADCHILVIDDEEILCEMLKETLEINYRVTTAHSGKKACKLIDDNNFDLVVTDLKLPDISGIDVLRYAKKKDEFTEVIVVTGYASLDTATLALNLGVYSYLVKPINVPDFTIQVQKAIASRLFHLKSLALMNQMNFVPLEAKEHLNDITSLYYFIRKLMLSLEIPEIMRITLDEINQKMGASLSLINVNLMGFTEVFAMPHTGEISATEVKTIVLQNCDKIFAANQKENFVKGHSPLATFKGKNGDAMDFSLLNSTSVPMLLTDRLIGTITLFHKSKQEFVGENNQYLYVFTSIVASVVEHGYSVLLARQQAKTDSLTGIANHRLFHETLEREIARANRKGTQFSLILIDIDNFKKINDTYGHQVGDAVLVDLTKRVSMIIRAGDVYARYGGEEFGLILPDTDQHGAEVLASRILTSFSSKPISYSQHLLSYTASMGIAIYNGTTPLKKDQLIEVADSALYDSKRNGKNRFTIGILPV